MKQNIRKLLGIALLALAAPLAGCSSVGEAVGAGAGGYAGYRVGCDDDRSREECAAATGAGAIGGAVIGGAVD
jgi:uncharacterized protein YceK